MRYTMRFRAVAAILMVMVCIAGMTACGQTQTAPADTAEALESCAAWLLDRGSEPIYGSINGEWVALGLARWDGEVPQAWFDRYYEAVEAHVAECGGVLDDRKYTEYSRVILALTAIGRDPADVGGYNLIQPLADFDQTVFQGINGPIYALLALDSGNYEIPENHAAGTQATREMYVDHILSKELPGGGWSLAGGEAEIDITAMALQALAKYRERQDVAEAVDRALTILSERQNEDGGYTAYDVDSSEAVSQVIVALTELGIGLEDTRFVKDGNTLINGLLRFRLEDGSFRHTLDGESDQLATEQAFYALVAADRMKQGKTSLYSMK